MGGVGCHIDIHSENIFFKKLLPKTKGLSRETKMTLPNVTRWMASFQNIVYLYIINFKQISGERSKATWLSFLKTVDCVCFHALHPRSHFFFYFHVWFLTYCRAKSDTDII